MCLSPITLTRKVGNRIVKETVPCGKCMECKKDLQNEFVIRSIEESYKYTSCWFVTLTYANENVSFTTDGELDENGGLICYNELNRKDLKKWKDRVRDNYKYHHSGETLDFSYCICGEYGPQTHRPHYHGLFFGLTAEQMELFKKDWEDNYGFTCIKRIPKMSYNGVNNVQRVANYCSKYMTKFNEFEDELVLDGVVEKPRKVTSIGYGEMTPERFIRYKRHVLAQDIYPEGVDINKMTKSEFNKAVKLIQKRRNYKMGNLTYKMPRYYQKRIFYEKKNDKYYATPLQRQVTYFMECDIRRDFAEQLEQIAAVNGISKDNPKDYQQLAKALQNVEENSRMDKAQSLYENNKKYIQKSKF